jgi:hypothetical protein
MRLALICMWGLLAAMPAAAQGTERLPWFAVDLHGASVGLPTAPGWVPEVDSDTPLPGRSWGLGGTVTVYPLKLGFATFGAGVGLVTASAAGESLTITTGSGAAATTRTTPIVRTRITSVLPQVSINFGHRLGWSYLSAGLGRSKVTSSADAVGELPAIVVPEAWNGAINFGGGAKWFMKPRLGASFDVRFTKLGTRGATATLPAASRTQMVTISVGVSIQ